MGHKRSSHHLQPIVLCILFSIPFFLPSQLLARQETRHLLPTDLQDSTQSVLLPVQFQKRADDQAPPVASLLSEIEQVQKDYLSTLEDTDPFYGLYLRGLYEQDMESHEDANSIGLEWEFFDLGWNESLQRIKQKKVDTKLQFLQMLANMQQKRLMEKIYLKNQVTIGIQGLIHGKKNDVLKALQEARKLQYDNGYATKDDYLTAFYKYQTSALLASHYRTQSTALLDKPAFDIINRCQSLVLLPIDVLAKRAAEKSVQIQIQNVLIQRSEFFPAWSDNLRLQVYARNVQRRTGDQEQIMGVTARLPLQTNGSRDDLIATEQDVYLKQKEAIRKRLSQRITGIGETLRFHQQRIRIGENEYGLMQQRLSDLGIEEQSSIPILDRTPSRSLDLLTIDILDKELEILLARMKVYEELLKLEALVLPENMVDMFEAIPPNN
jgi:hypothetical protein